MTIKSNKNKLKKILEKLNEGEPTEELRKEAQELLSQINPKELSEAEQELVNEGLPENELRHLCDAHIELMAEELEALKLKLSDDHPLQILIKEHDEILGILDRLSMVKNKIEKMDSYDVGNPVFAELKELGKKLLETEKHHEREEKALFPEVDKTGVTGPTRIMRMEHDDLWPVKEKIHELAQDVGNMNFDKFKEELNENAAYIVLTLRDHIFKEDNILYPTAKEVIVESKWDEIENKFDKIGYCSFTPGK